MLPCIDAARLLRIAASVRRETFVGCVLLDDSKVKVGWTATQKGTTPLAIARRRVEAISVDRADVDIHVDRDAVIDAPVERS